MFKNNIWNFWADRYEELWVQKYSLTPTRNLVIKEINEKFTFPKESLQLLDVGCGTGQLLEDIQKYLSEWDLALTGLDSSEKMIEMAKRKNLNDIEFILGDALSLPFSSEKFDILTCCHSFPYYSDKIKALKEFSRVVKKNGWIFLVQASENNIYDTLVMKVVKLTTGKASYPSLNHIKKMVEDRGCVVREQKFLKNKFFMPSIILSIIQNGVGK